MSRSPTRHRKRLRESSLPRREVTFADASLYPPQRRFWQIGKHRLALLVSDSLCIRGGSCRVQARTIGASPRRDTRFAPRSTSGRAESYSRLARLSSAWKRGSDRTESQTVPHLTLAGSNGSRSCIPLSSQAYARSLSPSARWAAARLTGGEGFAPS